MSLGNKLTEMDEITDRKYVESFLCVLLFHFAFIVPYVFLFLFFSSVSVSVSVSLSLSLFVVVARTAAKEIASSQSLLGNHICHKALINWLNKNKSTCLYHFSHAVKRVFIS